MNDNPIAQIKAMLQGTKASAKQIAALLRKAAASADRDIDEIERLWATIGDKRPRVLQLIGVSMESFLAVDESPN